MQRFVDRKKVFNRIKDSGMLFLGLTLTEYVILIGVSAKLILHIKFSDIP